MHDSLVLDIIKILGGSLPIGIQDKTLIVLGLGEDTGPGVKKCRRGLDSAMNSLVFDQYGQ